MGYSCFLYLSQSYQHCRHTEGENQPPFQPNQNDHAAAHTSNLKTKRKEINTTGECTKQSSVSITRTNSRAMITTTRDYKLELRRKITLVFFCSSSVKPDAGSGFTLTYIHLHLECGHLCREGVLIVFENVCR